MVIPECRIEKLLFVNYCGVNTVCIFILVEVLGRTFFDFNIFDFISRTKDATATVGGVIYRGYGLSTEPTQVGNYFCCFMPYAIYYRAALSPRNTGLYTIMLVLCAILTFSAGLIIVASISAVVFLILKSRPRVLLQVISFATGAVIFLVAVISILQEPYSSMAALVFDILSDKILLSTDGTSVSTVWRLWEMHLTRSSRRLFRSRSG